MKTTRILLLTLFLFCFVSFITVASAEELPLQVDTTSYLVSAQWLPVGDEDGHVIGLQKREGEAVFINGETAKYLNVFTLDFRRGQGGSAAGYSKFIFEDGSFILCSWTTDLTVTQGLFSKQGQGTIIKASGRFVNMAGTATFTGKQLKPAEADPKLTATTTYYFTLP